MAAPDITPYTNGIADRMFFETADLNYIGARAAFFDQRNWDFWWLTLHAMEKYLKTLLLMNGCSAMRGGHDLFKLLPQVKRVDPRLVPPPFVHPRISGLDHWPLYPDQKFLERLNEYGSASNRYGTYGYTLFTSDLLRADQLIYWARRHARPLTQTMTIGPPIDWISELALSPSHWMQARGPLEKIAALPARNSRRWPLVHLNAAFFPRLRHRARSSGSSATNPPIAEWCERLQEAGPGSDTHRAAHDVISWVLKSIQLTRPDEKELRDLLQKHPVP